MVDAMAEAELKVTVIGPARMEDLLLPTDRPIGELLPGLVARLSERPATAEDEWLIGPLGQGPYPLESRLGEHDANNGLVLYLRNRNAAAVARPMSPPRPVTPSPATSVPPPVAVAPVPSQAPASSPPPPPAAATGGPPAAAPARPPTPPPPDPTPSLPDPAPSPPPTPPPAPAEERPAPAPGPPPTPLLLERTRMVLPPRRSRLVRAGRSLREADSGGNPARPTAVPEPAREAPPSTASAPSPAALSLPSPGSPLGRARSEWGAGDYVTQLDRAIAAPRLRRSVTVAVVSPKGGVGKTTVTALLGTLLALVRRDRIVAVDCNPDFGSLGRALSPEHDLFVDDLVGVLSRPGLTATELDASMARAAHGLMVLPAPTDPARMARLDEPTYLDVIHRLQAFAGVLLLDCGTGLQEPAAKAALASADQLVLVSDAEPATASLVAEAGVRLGQTERPMILVVNKMRSGRGLKLDIDRLSSLLPTATAAVVVPDDPVAAGQLAGGSFGWDAAPAGWRVASREMAVALLADWDRLGLCL